MTKRHCIYYFGCILALLMLGSCAKEADVAQGKTLVYDKNAQTITIEEYNTNFTAENKYGTPTGKKLVFNLSGALIGATPDPGNIVRIAYKTSGKQDQAIRLMNVTKQDIMKGK
jgi:hypothetical protein